MKDLKENLNFISIRRKGTHSCPDCDLLMTPYSCENIVIDKCDSCEGIWFDKGEFGIFKKNLDRFDLTKIKKIYHEPTSEDLQISVCYDCDTTLDVATYAYNTKVHVKRCGVCKGIWLPINETLNLIEMAKLSQEISEDTSAFAKEVGLQHNIIQRSKNLKSISKQFTRRITWMRAHTLRSSLGFFPTVLPLYDENPRKNSPLVTLVLIAINVMVFYFMSISDLSLSEIYSTYALQPNEFVNFNSSFTIITSIFMHAGFFHLIGNMFFLWTFGDNIEDQFGKSKYLFFYILCGLAASATHILSSVDSMIPTLGASGAVAGVMGAYLYLFPKVNMKTMFWGFIIDLPAAYYLIFWFSLQVVWAMLYLGSGSSGVAWWAHIGGFATGLIFSYFFKKFETKTKIN